MIFLKSKLKQIKTNKIGYSPIRWLNNKAKINFRDSTLMNLKGKEKEKNLIEIEWENKKTRFHPIWLRDHCKCEECVDKSSNQKLYMIEQNSFEIFPLTMEQKADSLLVEWSDNHKSEYALGELSKIDLDSINNKSAKLKRRRINAALIPSTEHLYGFNDPLEKIELKRWDKSILFEDEINEPIDFKDFITDRNKFKLLFERIYKYGLCFLSNVPIDSNLASNQSHSNNNQIHSQKNSDPSVKNEISSRIHQFNNDSNIKRKQVALNDLLLKNNISSYFQHTTFDRESQDYTSTSEKNNLQSNTEGDNEKHAIDYVADQLAMARRNTFYGKTWQVKVTEKATNLAYSSKPITWHNDLLYFESPPGLQLLHCIENNTKGGETCFVDGTFIFYLFLLVLYLFSIYFYFFLFFI